MTLSHDQKRAALEAFIASYALKSPLGEWQDEHIQKHYGAEFNHWLRSWELATEAANRVLDEVWNKCHIERQALRKQPMTEDEKAWDRWFHDGPGPAMLGADVASRAAWLAAIEWERSREKKPVCYGIFADDGEMFWDSEHCISDGPDDLDSWLDELQTDQPERGWKILPMVPIAPPKETQVSDKEKP